MSAVVTEWNSFTDVKISVLIAGLSKRQWLSASVKLL